MACRAASRFARAASSCSGLSRASDTAFASVAALSRGPSPQPARQGVLSGDYCGGCGMVGHSTHACTTFTGPKPTHEYARIDDVLKSVAQNVDWEVSSGPHICRDILLHLTH